MHAFATFMIASIAAPAALGGTVMFADNQNNSSAEVMYEILASDNGAGLFEFDVSIAADSPNSGDIVALYFSFDVDDAEDGYSSSDFSGSAITDVEFNTRNVQNGNIGQKFDFGLAIGTPGAGNDFFDSFTFTMNIRNGLTLDDLMLFGVRGTSVGYESTEFDPGNDSAKTFVGYTGPVSSGNAIPLPSGAGLVLAGMGFVAGTRRRQAL